jgi:autotransporter-associated beta strand protein
MRIKDSVQSLARNTFIAVLSLAAPLAISDAACAQRALGVDVSYWQSEITQNAWNHAYNNTNRRFAFVRATRGGTTGLGQTSGTPGNPTQETLSRRYDDSRFIQNMVRANAAGLMTGPYHFERADLLTNTGTDEADHFMQMAGVYMRPGYMLPMYDLEAGQSQRTQQELAQFSLDFSNRIYEVMKIRPSIYANGNYMNDLSGADAATRNALAQPAANAPSMVSPAFPVLFAARYPAGSGQPYNEAVHGSLQTQNPKDAGSTLSWFFGPFDDYGNSQPWHFWQYGSGEAPFGSLGDTTTDGDVSQGDIEFVRDTLVPAVWWNDSSGDWSTLTNWNSGQPIVAPQVGAGQAAQFTTGPLPVARLPGAAGTGPTAGQYDTVILERPSANITVTVSTGTHNVRKLYTRESLNITGGSLTINYDPNYNNDFDNNPATNFPGALRSGPISAQFSGAVTLSGTGSLSVHTLQVDAARTFTLAGSTGALTFNKLDLMAGASPAKLLVNGDVTINPLSNGNPLNSLTATIANSGSGTSGFVDLGGGTRGFNIGNGGADVDLDVAVPITNGGLTKSGAGTMRLSGVNTFAGAVTVNAGVLRYNHSSGLQSTTLVTVNNGGTLDMNGFSDTVSALASTAGHTTGVVTQGIAGFTLSAASGTFSYGGTISGTGTLTKSGAATQTLSGNNSLGPVSITAGKLVFNGTNTTGNVTVGTNGVLGGIGSVSGTVIVNSTGHIAPGASIESLGVGALTLNTGAVLDFELGAGGVMDLINVTGLLNIAGSSTVNLTDLGGMTTGLYTLIDYGTISGSAASLGEPVGPSTYKYSLIDTGSLINLRVSLFGDFNFDDKVDGADYIVWRKGLGTVYSQADYDTWRAHFGEVAGSGSGVGLGAAVPEPATAGLLLGLLLPSLAQRRRRS